MASQKISRLLTPEELTIIRFTAPVCASLSPFPSVEKRPLSSNHDPISSTTQSTTSLRRCVPTVSLNTFPNAHATRLPVAIIDLSSNPHRSDVAQPSTFQFKNLWYDVLTLLGSIFPVRGEAHPDSIRTDETPRLTEPKLFPTLSSRRFGMIPPPLVIPRTCNRNTHAQPDRSFRGGSKGRCANQQIMPNPSQSILPG